MDDYSPLDLSALCNAGISLVPDGPPKTGQQLFQGLPFLIAGPLERCFLGFGPERRRIEVPVGRPAQRVLFAHRVLDCDLAHGGSPGRLIATYAFKLAGGRRIEQLVRERFEISYVPTPFEGPPWLPFLAVPDTKHGLQPRYSGPWGEAGVRQREATQGRPHSYVLWSWLNPEPDEAIAEIEIIPAGPRFLVAAITLGLADEEPFVRSGRRAVGLSLRQKDDASAPFQLEVDVDRGVATYPQPLPAEPGFPGWGAPANAGSSPAYVEIAAVPSATVEVRSQGQHLASFRWGELENQGHVDTPRVRVELLDPGRNWVQTSVVDAGTGQPLPCRIHFESPAGVPYQPHGHHNQVNSGLSTWNIDVGGDLRLGQTSYAYIDGACQGWLPRGDVVVEVARGFEYEPLRTTVAIAPGQQRLELRLERRSDVAAEGWYSGDTHVHFLSTQGAHVEAAAEGLNVVNLLQSQWGHLFSSVEEFTGRASPSADGQTVVYASQENRQHMLGHLSLLGLQRPVMPWCSDGPNEAELGGTLEITLADWADQCHAQGGTVVAPHFPMTNGELAALIATQRTDGLEFISYDHFAHLEYYRYLNAGYRLPLAGGTDKMSNEVPVGLYRTYVRIPAEEGFSYAAWCRNLALGRSILSGGPLLSFKVEGAEVGDTIRLPAGGGWLEVEASAESIFPIHSLQIVQRGQIVASSDDAGGARRLSLHTRLKADGSTWLAARAGGPGYLSAISHHDVWRRGIFAHTSPIYVDCGSELSDQDTLRYMLTLVGGALEYVRHSAAGYPDASTTHHHGQHDHLAYLERPFHEAAEAITQRLSRAGG